MYPAFKRKSHIPYVGLLYNEQRTLTVTMNYRYTCRKLFN